jgi:uncharacterized protein (DUF924 family)
MHKLASEILSFWFEELSAKQHFVKDDAVDEAIKTRFAAEIPRAAAGGFDDWQEGCKSALALVILLDQFPRNAFRNSPQAFAYDRVALSYAREMVRKQQDMALNLDQRSFVYIPYMHAEDLAAQEACIQLFSENCPREDNIRFAIIHRDIIRDHGRFPHRNETLGRTSTKAELAFLKGDGFKG